MYLWPIIWGRFCPTTEYVSGGYCPYAQPIKLRGDFVPLCNQLCCGGILPLNTTKHVGGFCSHVLMANNLGEILSHCTTEYVSGEYCPYALPIMLRRGFCPHLQPIMLWGDFVPMYMYDQSRCGGIFSLCMTNHVAGEILSLCSTNYVRGDFVPLQDQSDCRGILSLMYYQSCCGRGGILSL